MHNTLHVRYALKESKWEVSAYRLFPRLGIGHQVVTCENYDDDSLIHLVLPFVYVAELFIHLCPSGLHLTDGLYH